MKKQVKINAEAIETATETKETAIMNEVTETATSVEVNAEVKQVAKSGKGIVILSGSQIAGKRMNETRIFSLDRKAEAEAFAASAKANGQKVKVHVGSLEGESETGKGIVILSGNQIAGKRMNETRIFSLDRKAEAEAFAASAKANGQKVKVHVGNFA